MDSEDEFGYNDLVDGPFEVTRIRDHLARLREVSLQMTDDSQLVAYTDDEIAARARASGVAMTRAYVQLVSNGGLKSPSAEKLVGLANAFNVSPGYFFSASVRLRTNRRLDARLDQLRRDMMFGSCHETAEHEESQHP